MYYILNITFIPEPFCFDTQAVTDEKSAVLFSATLNLGKEAFQVFVSNSIVVLAVMNHK